MIGIDTYNPKAIARYVGEAGLGSHQVIYNPRHPEQCSVLVQVGGHGVRSNHGYIQKGQTPVIQCLDPKTLRAEPTNRTFILCALDKARRLDLGEIVEPRLEIIIAKTLHDIYEFFMNLNGPLSCDIECSPDTGEITCIAFAYQTHSSCPIQALCIPLQHETWSYWDPQNEPEVWSLIAQFLTNDNPKVLQNFIFDTMILSRFGVETKGKIYDTMQGAHLLQPELPKGLKDLGRLYLDIAPWKDVGSFVSNQALWEYNARDAAYTLAILHKQFELLDSRRLTFFQEHLAPLSTEVLRMCERGWTPDFDAIGAMKDVLEPEIDTLLADLRVLVNPILPAKETFIYRRGKPKPGASYCRGVGLATKWVEKENKKGEAVLKTVAYSEYQDIDIPADTKYLRDLDFPVFERVVEVRDFNPSSPNQVKDAIIGFGYKVPTKKGGETTDELALKKLQAKTKNPFFDKILAYRAKSKMMSTYCNVRTDDDKKLRFSINVCGTVGGRFSSRQTPWGTGFNAQNIPRRFRHISLPSTPGWVIVNMDFKQADPHLVAWLAGEDQMLEILSDPEGDLHSHTAKLIYGYDIAKESKERKVGKACNNGLNYGMGINRFIETCRQGGLVLSYEEASHAHRSYFEAYPGVKIWQKSVEAELAKSRTLQTPFGRKRYFYGHWGYKILQDAYAYIPPTTVADALNVGWLNFISIASNEGITANVLQQCHDSLKLECPLEVLDRVVDALKRAYSAVIFQIGNYTCNLPIDIEYGPNWGDLKPYDPS